MKKIYSKSEWVKQMKNEIGKKVTICLSKPNGESIKIRGVLKSVDEEGTVEFEKAKVLK